MPSQNIQVHIKIRSSPSPYLHTAPPTLSINAHTFTFTHIHTQPDISSHLQPTIQSFLAGNNTSIICYGQTGSGKTYTMGLTASHIETCTGIVPASMRMLIERVSVYLAVFEIYNEEVYDLLDGRARIVLRNCGAELVINAHEREICTYEQFGEAVVGAIARRVTKSTRMNAGSSRSHAVIRVRTACATLVFIDLAGSERTKRTGVSNDTMREAISINTGLLALGNVINALYNRKRFVPYRDSKLTRILKPILDGNTVVRMIACVSDRYQDANETMNTLEYANRAGCLRTAVRREPVIGKEQGEVMRLQEEIGRLRRENEWLRKELKEKTGREPCRCIATQGLSTTARIVNDRVEINGRGDGSANDRVNVNDRLNVNGRGDGRDKVSIDNDINPSTSPTNTSTNPVSNTNPSTNTPIRNKVINTVPTPVRREGTRDVQVPTPIRKINFDLSRNLTLDVGHRKVRRIIDEVGISEVGIDEVGIGDSNDREIETLNTTSAINALNTINATANALNTINATSAINATTSRTTTSRANANIAINKLRIEQSIQPLEQKTGIVNKPSRKNKNSPQETTTPPKRMRTLNGLKHVHSLAVHSSTILSIMHLNGAVYTTSSDNTLRRTAADRTAILKRCLFLSLLACNEHGNVLYTTHDALYAVDGALIVRYDTAITGVHYKDTLVVTGHVDGRVRVCDVRMGVLYENTWHRGCVNAVGVYDGVLYTGCVDGTVCYAGMAGGTVQGTCTCLSPAHNNCVNLIFMHKGYVFSGSKEGTIRKWKDCRLVKECRTMHSSFMRAGAADAHSFDTGCKDGVVKRWNDEIVEGGSVRLPCSVVCMDGTGDGVVVGGSDGNVYFVGCNY